MKCTYQIKFAPKFHGSFELMSINLYNLIEHYTYNYYLVQYFSVTYIFDCLIDTNTTNSTYDFLNTQGAKFYTCFIQLKLDIRNEVKVNILFFILTNTNTRT